MMSSIERVPTRLHRWVWTHHNRDGSATFGWTATKWGARRAIEQAESEDVPTPREPTTPDPGVPEKRPRQRAS